MSADRKVYFAGEEGSPLSSVTGQPVRMDEIRANYNMDNLWEDLDFLGRVESIGPLAGDSARGSAQLEELKRDPYSDPKTYQWVRPQEYCKKNGIDRPQFAVVQDGLSTERCSENDVMQGSGLGDCWFVCSIQALTTKPEMRDWVIPEDNFTGFDDDKYCGAFHFRFYIVSDDKWVDVVVDDRLPMRGDGVMAMANVRSHIKAGYAEFWVALLEKAYAKLHGSYKAIEGGFASQALENFTGGFAEMFDLEEQDTREVGLAGEGQALLGDQYETIRGYLLTYIKSDVFLGTGSYSSSHPNWAKVKAAYGDDGLGLHTGHAYSIQDVQEVNLRAGGSKVLVKLRNPWGYAEWSGDFSDTDDANWSQMERDLRVQNEFRSTNVNEGSFWMELRDLMRYFKTLQVCHYGLTDGTQLARAKGVWGPALQDMSPIKIWEDYYRYTAYKFEVQQGAAAAKYSAQSGGKAIVCYSVAIDGYNSLASPPVFCYADLYKMDSPNQRFLDVLRGKCIRSTMSNGREASSWTFVDPGTYLILPRLHVGVVWGKQSPPPEFAGKDIGFCVRVFTENVTTVEPWAQNA